MLKQIFLNKNRGKRSVDVESGLMVPLSAEERLLPFDDIIDVVNLKDVYDKERDSSDLYRLIFTINPVCSNVLFNTFTEVVYKEGDNNCQMLTSSANSKIPKKACNTSPLTQAQAIMDTEYSHPNICEDLVYHCGTDIFNNHILRSSGFVAVSKMGSSGDKTIFNTIKDFQRDKDGNTVVINNGSQNVNLHLYNADNLLTFKEAFRERLIEDDGWFGFTNTSLIDIPNVNVNGVGMVTVNKVMNNNKACEFIDMFPDRSLYSFIPKINKYRNRIEPNWDYCLTYPYRNEYAKFQELNGTTNFQDFHGIRIVKITEGANESGISSIFFESMIKHNISVGDYVRLYYVVNGELKRCPLKTKVTNVGDHTNMDKTHVFSVSQNTLDRTFYEYLDNSYDVDTDTFSLEVFFKKETFQGECDYYFRIFRKIPNFATSTKNIYDMNNDVEDVIVNCKKDYFKSENNKLSFSQNIYGDKSSQILFTDTIDLTRLVDNNGRKLTEIFLTVVKRNKGYGEWYKNAQYGNEEIEFSRAFGEVTSGLDLGLNDRCFNYNVRRLHNVEDSIIRDNAVLRIPKRPEALEKGLTINGWNELSVRGLFYGDIVEKNPDTCNETTLEDVYHRFNTAQRETSSSVYSEIKYDVLLQDDNLDNFSYGSGKDKDFKIGERKYGKEENTNKVNNANIAPEGYYYHPHFKIKVNDVDETLTEKDTILVNFSKSDAYLASGQSGARLTVKSPKNYDFKKNDVFLLYEKGNFNKNHHWGFLTGIRPDNEIVITFETILKSMVSPMLTGINKGDYILVKTDTNIPAYAIPSQNIPYKFKWRAFVKPSEASSDSDITTRPFTNGTHYIHTNINFYLRRQDPFGVYNLQYGVRDGDDSSVPYNPMIDLTPYGDYKDITSHEYYSSDDFNPCIV